MRVIPFERMVFNAEGYVYFGYPYLSYEEGLNNIVAAVNEIIPYKEYTVDELEPLLLKLNVDPFTFVFFRKTKHILIENGVTLCATFGEESCLSNYGEFKIKDNRVILNLAVLIMDSKVERGAQIAQVIVHELAHSLVAYKTINIWDPNGYANKKPLSESEKTAIINLEIIFNHISKCQVIFEEYGLIDSKEMMAELVNPEFVAKFSQIKINCLKLQTSPEKNQIFKKFFLCVTQLFSGKALYVNAHDAALKNFDVLAKTNSHPQINFFNENLYPLFQSQSSEPDPENKSMNKVLTRDDAFRFRAFDFPRLIKERDDVSKSSRLISASIRSRKMQTLEDFI